MMLANHFEQPRRSFQAPCDGTGLVFDVKPSANKLEHQHADCPYCKQSILLVENVPSKRRGGLWERP